MRLHRGQLSPLRFGTTYHDGSENNYFTGTAHGWNYANFAHSNGYLYCYPIFFPRNFFMKVFGVVCSIYTSPGTIKFGIYEDKTDGIAYVSPNWRWPGKNIVASGDVAVNGVGFYSVALSPPRLFVGGKLYWGAFRAASGSFFMKASHLVFAQVLGWDDYGLTFDNKFPRGYSGSQSWADPFPAQVLFSMSERTPILFFRELNQNGS